MVVSHAVGKRPAENDAAGTDLPANAGQTFAEPAAGELSLPTVLHALSESTRLAVVRQIDSAGEQLCGSFRVDVAKSTLSQHLRVLRKAGVTHTRPYGTQRWISLRRADLERRFPGLLDVVLAAHDANS